MRLPRFTKKRLLLVLGGVGLVVGGLALGYYIDRHVPYWHFRTVEEGAFYRTSQLDGEELSEALQDYGIRTIINLRDVPERTVGDWYEVEKRVAAANGVRLLDIPLKAGTPPSPQQIETILAVMDDPKNLPVLVHCYHGSIRSAAAEGLFRREYLGEGGEEAYERCEKWGRNLKRTYPEISNFILHYVPRRDRKAAAEPQPDP